MRFGNPTGSRRGLRTTPRPPLLAPEGAEVVAAAPRERELLGQHLASGRGLDCERQREGRRPLLVADPVDGRPVATRRPSYEIVAAAVLRHPAPELHRGLSCRVTWYESSSVPPGRLGTRGGTLSLPDVIGQRFRLWLEGLTEIEGRGKVAAIARETGLDASFVSRLLSKDRQGYVTLRTIQEIAEHRRLTCWELLWCIENGISDLPPPPSAPRSRTRARPQLMRPPPRGR